MRTLCDVCEAAAAILFCAADEAALCRACDDKGSGEAKVGCNQVHMCNKLASRHVRVGLAEPSEVPRCDICENAPAFFYCEVDGTSLCLQCDMIVHVGGKRTHGRYLLLRQRVEFPVEKSGSGSGSGSEPGSQRVNHRAPKRESNNHADIRTDNNTQNDGKMDNMLIDLNTRPHRMDGQDPNNQGRGRNSVDNNHESESVVPDGCLKGSVRSNEKV